MKKNIFIRFLDFGTIRLEAGGSKRRRELVKGANVLIRVYKILALSFGYFVFVFLAADDLKSENYLNVLIHFITVYAGVFIIIFFPFLLFKFDKLIKKITDYLES